MLTLNHYTVTADKKQILNNISHTFNSGIHLIMGPNGSGKSTFALSLSGSPEFSLDPTSSAVLGEQELLSLKPYKRAQKGLFVSFQSPPSLSGVTVFGMLRTALHGKVEAFDLKKSIESYAQELAIPKELLSRSLNEGFSGGERKKMELLQMAILKPRCAILDEIDTGVDRDALRSMTSFLKKLQSDIPTIIIITHRTSFAKELTADSVTIFKNGSLLVSGDFSLAQDIDTHGYEHFH